MSGDDGKKSEKMKIGRRIDIGEGGYCIQVMFHQYAYTRSPPD